MGQRTRKGKQLRTATHKTLRSTVPSFEGLLPASPAASSVKSKNTSTNTTHELILRKALKGLGLKFTTHSAHLRGRPDIVFEREKVAVFCDGDFWHGRNWQSRRAKLVRGHNAEYWVAKIEANIRRDARTRRALRREGWTVLRLWESQIKVDARKAALRVAGRVVEPRRKTR